ncbi:WRB/Get1 family [Hyaloraphidium curvatum]|nr:WRB/Get1 family [Hyaloraphidium curvatum]
MAALFLLLLIALAIELLEFVGYDWVSQKAQDAYLHRLVSKTNKLKAEVMQARAELQATSSQDEFAKWAKLRRKLDGKLQELEVQSKEIGMEKTKISFIFTIAIRAVVFVLPIAVLIWFRAVPMFHLPGDWLGWVGSFVSLPFAPAGSVSGMFWYQSCRAMFARALKGVDG